MAKTLGELLKDVVAAEALKPIAGVTVQGVTDDSRLAGDGFLFVAVRGATVDGHAFISGATERGAAAVLCEQPVERCPVPQVVVDDSRRALAIAAARFHEVDPVGARGFGLVGITGTNGKSTTAFLARAILTAANRRTALLGTLQYDLLSRRVDSEMTTPGAATLAALLGQARRSGADAAVLEVSSHALDQARTDGLRFSAAAFTNLSGDHLDYHATIDSYADAKARLFAGLDEQAVAVVNADDERHVRMIRDCRARIIRVSLQHKTEVCGRVVRDTIRGTQYRLRIDGVERRIETPLLGRHNVYNALTAAALAHGMGVSLDLIERGLQSVHSVPGRLQRVDAETPGPVFVDYAHTDDALTNVLSVLRPLASKRLIVVFGCGGDRDRTKRARMAAVAGKWADAVIVTSDNPRGEPPEAIIDDILKGFDREAGRHFLVEPDRAQAIRVGVGGMRPGDVLLIAGKGHEDYQIVGERRVHFDDVEVARQAARDLVTAR